MDLRDGISTTKSSEDFIKFKFEEDGADELYLAVAGPEKAITYEDTDFTIYLVNKGEEKSVELVSENFEFSAIMVTFDVTRSEVVNFNAPFSILSSGFMGFPSGSLTFQVEAKEFTL